MPTMFMPQTSQKRRIENNKKEYALYVHIPFCKQKCHFCSIKTAVYDEGIMETYKEALLRELRKYADAMNLNCIKCVHIGGGTPSLLSTKQTEEILRALVQYLNKDNLEITFEAHPESLSYEKIDLLTGFSKLTLNIGIQTFQEKQLSAINRPVNKTKMIECLLYVQKKEFYDIGIDIIAGLPYSSTASVMEDIDIALELGVDTISLYPLWIERGAYLHKNSFSEMPGKKERVRIMEKAEQKMKKSGYSSKALFHWSKNVKASYQYAKHQRNGGEWVGIGAGAYSYLNHKVYLNHVCINDYVAMTKQDNTIYFSSDKQTVTSQIIWEISFMVRNGYLDREYICDRYGEIIEPFIKKLFVILCEYGYAYEEKKRIYITSKGKVYLEEVERVIKGVIGGGSRSY